MSNDVFNALMSYNAGEKKAEIAGSGSAAGDVDIANPNELPSTKMLKKLETWGFNLEELQPLMQTKGSLLVISGAGSGKTTGLMFKIIYDFITGELTRRIEINGNNVRVQDRVLVSTFLKSGSDDIKKRIVGWQNKLGVFDFAKNMEFSTLHAEFKRALTALGVGTNIIDTQTANNCLRRALTDLGIKNAKGRALNAEELNDLQSALSYTRNRLDEYRYENKVYSDLKMHPALIDYVLERSKQNRQEAGKVDFEDLQELLYDLVYKQNREDVREFLSKRYSYLYLDEFQDTSQIQYELIKVYASGAKKIVAIGDDDQTIYTWRGSDNNIITRDFEKDFSPTVVRLGVNYRCPSTILEAIVPSIEKNKNRYEKDLRSSQDGGVFRLGGFHTHAKMVASLTELVKEDVRSGRTVAVLCRVNSDGLLPALMLHKAGIPFSLSGEGMTLNSYIGRLALSVPKLLTERATNSVQMALEQLVWDKQEVRTLLKALKERGESIWTIDPEDFLYSCPNIAPLALNWRLEREKNGESSALDSIFSYYIGKVFDSDSNFSQVVKAALMTLRVVFQEGKYESIAEYLNEMQDISSELLARVKLAGKQVQISTVHDYKGKEADSVYVWNNSKDIFPHRQVVKGGGVVTEEALEEERRIHYIANTRARLINTNMFIIGSEGRFLKEMDLKNAEELGFTALEMDLQTGKIS